MGLSDVQTIIAQVEKLLAEEELSERVEAAIHKLLNAVEALSVDKKSLADEVERLRKQLDQKKKGKTTSGSKKDDQSDNQNSDSDYSSEKRRQKLKKKPLRKAIDRRSFKDLTIHETVECPVDPATLPPDAVRLDDEVVIVQDIEIKPKNTKFQRQVFYSATHQQCYRGPLPAGCDRGDFSANLRALIIALKYCGNMSEPKIGEFLDNFDVQVSAGSISNILTHSASDFEQDYHDVLVAGLSSTTYQQTDDTSARVKGEFWHTHIFCNPFYTLYSTRPHKDRLAVLEVLQNTDELQFRLSPETLQLLQTEFSLPKKWRQKIADLGEVDFAAPDFKTLLDDWFGERNKQLRTAIEHASRLFTIAIRVRCQSCGRWFATTPVNSSCSRTSWLCVGFTKVATTRNFFPWLVVTQKPWMLSRIAFGTTTHPCKTIVLVRRRSWQPSCDWNSTSCFRRARDTRLWMIGLRKRSRNATSY